jgi:hypothetical protein
MEEHVAIPPQEMTGDEADSLVARIKERASDPLRASDFATGVSPIPTVALPATPAEIIAAERALGFGIPSLLRRLYLEVGNGGFGPEYGMAGVPTIPPTPGVADIVALYDQYATPDPAYPDWKWPPGLVPLISGGCLFFECVNFINPPYSVVMFDGNVADWRRSFSLVASSLKERLESWLAGSS